MSNKSYLLVWFFFRRFFLISPMTAVKSIVAWCVEYVTVKILIKQTLHNFTIMDSNTRMSFHVRILWTNIFLNMLDWRKCSYTHAHAIAFQADFFATVWISSYFAKEILIPLPTFFLQNSHKIFCTQFSFLDLISFGSEWWTHHSNWVQSSAFECGWMLGIVNKIVKLPSNWG